MPASIAAASHTPTRRRTSYATGFAGTPPTGAPRRTSRVTTARGSTIASSPTVTPRRTLAPSPIRARAPIVTGVDRERLHADRLLDVLEDVVEVDDHGAVSELRAGADRHAAVRDDRAALAQDGARRDLDPAPGRHDDPRALADEAAVAEHQLRTRRDLEAHAARDVHVPSSQDARGSIPSQAQGAQEHAAMLCPRPTRSCCHATSPGVRSPRCVSSVDDRSAAPHDVHRLRGAARIRRADRRGDVRGRTGAARPPCPEGLPDLIRDGFPQPAIRASRDGSLTTTLKMSKGRATINGKTYFDAQTYEDTFPGPTLVLCRGDRLEVKLDNGLAEPTNLHVHGLHVSPVANHDNIFLNIPARGSQDYEYDLPDDHEAGAFWYHPHLHGFVSAQIFGGLSGAIVVKGPLDDKLAGVPQRLMMIQSTELCDPDLGPDGQPISVGEGHSVAFPLTALSASDPESSGSEECDVPGRVIDKPLSNERFTPLLINGTINPTVNIRPGEIQRWRIFNANNNRIVVLNLEGQPFEVLAMDGNTLRRPMTQRYLRIGPGSRREVLVRGGHADSYRMTALSFAQFPTGGRPDTTSKNGGPTPNQTVLTVESSGTPAHDRLPRTRFTRTGGSPRQAGRPPSHDLLRRGEPRRPDRPRHARSMHEPARRQVRREYRLQAQRRGLRP